MSMRVDEISTTVTLRLVAIAVRDRWPRRFRGDQRASNFGIARIENADRDVRRHRGQDRGGMQHLGAEEREFRRLIKRKLRNDLGAGHQARVRGQHAVNVGPDLNLRCAEARANDGRGVVGAAPAQRGGDAVGGCADKAAKHGDDSPWPAAEPVRHSFGFCLLHQRRRRGVFAVGDHHLPGIDPVSGQAMRPERGGHDAAAGKFTNRGDGIEPPRRDLFENSQRRNDPSEGAKLLAEERLDFRP